MAFTNTPDAATHQTRRLPIVGGQTISSNVLPGVTQFLPGTYQGARFINCYPKRQNLVNTDDEWGLTKCPPIQQSIKTFASSGTDPIGCISSDGVYIWKGRRLYTNNVTPALVYTGPNAYVVKSMFLVTNPVSANPLYAGILRDTTTSQMHSYTWDASTSTFTLSAAVAFLETSTVTPFQSLFYNGRLYSIGTDKRIYNTAAGNYLSWSTTSFIVPEVRGDNIVAIVLYKNTLVALSEQSIEFLQDQAIEIGSPLLRQDAYTQLYGIRDANNIAVSGDFVFFLSYEDRYGYGVYVLDNYQPKRISNFYVDTLLNNDDLTGQQPFNTKLAVVDFYGDPCLLFNTGFGGALYVDNVYVEPVYTSEIQNVAGFPFIGFSTKQTQWFDFAFSNATDYIWNITVQNPGFFQLAPDNTNAQWQTYFVSSYTTDTANTYYFNKDYNPSDGSTAEAVFNITDFGSNRWKHIKTVDFVGDSGNNSVSLSWTNNSDYSGWSAYVSKNQTTLGFKNAIRWHNLGRHRQSAYRVRFQGTSNIHCRGLEVNYNLGTQ